MLIRFDYEKDGIAVFKKKTKNPKLMCFAGRGVVTAPYTDVAEFIKNPESAFFWDKFLIVYDIQASHKNFISAHV